MKLYITPGSPYARIARVVVLEKGLAGAVEVIAAPTRTTASPYYAVNPSGRVPYLVLDDGTGMEDSDLICQYLDRLDGRPKLWLPLDHADWEYGRLAMTARSMTDGIAVLGREMRRPETERSPGIISHEIARAGRLADYFNNAVSHPLMSGSLNLAQLILLAGLDFVRFHRLADLEGSRSALGSWAASLRRHPSVAATVPA